MATDYYEENVMLIFDKLSHFSVKYILWYILELPHRGDPKGMQQCIF